MFNALGIYARLAIVGAGAAVLIGCGFWGCYHFIYVPEHDAYVSFVASTKKVGEDQIAANTKQAAADKLSKENADEQIKSMGDMLTLLSSGLHNARTGRGYLPPTSPGSVNPDRLCFSRTKLDAILGYIDAAGTNIALQRDSAMSDLYVSCQWAKNRR